MDDFEGFKVSVEEVTVDVVEIARELELEVEPENVNSCNLMIKLECLQSYFLWMSNEKWCLKMESASGDDAMKFVEMTAEDLEMTKSQLIKWQGLRGMYAILKEVLLWVKCYQTVLRAIEKLFPNRRVS